MRASIIIVNWNGKHLLGECLDSVFAQSFEDFEVILVDNASTDGSAELVKENYPRVRIIQNSENAGFARANNLGAKAAGGDYLVLLNYDTAVEKGWLGALLAPMEQDPTIGCTSSKVIFYGKRDLINSAGTFFSFIGVSGSLGDAVPRTSFMHPFELFAPTGASFAVRRKLYAEIGGFDESYFMYDEDVDLGWRIWNAGFRVVFIPDSIAYHKYSPIQKPYKYYYILRNKFWTIWKNARARDLLWLLPLSFISSLSIALLFIPFLKFQNSLSAFRGIIDAFKHLPARSPPRGSEAMKRVLWLSGTIRVFGRKFKKHFLA